ncbi:hypothetical protein GBA65_03055 [Rubrobacter marinus]|uniref:Uncharacterized protein n=1 Tax=Rubrobacter marinus TaxID=2653852 RepID=A0A6G8PTJ5_9ACTN|nr:hypothetical protein [Rubrobacter marinus]QIN77653.1 hypothetical protein GBA65_03055 [Rubrobacter marinus]
MARKRNVRGPYNIAQWVTRATGNRVTGQAVSRYFYGESWPRPAFVSSFARAFDLTRDERDVLAWAYTYGPFPEGASDEPDSPSSDGYPVAR